ncbi:Tudor, plant [Spatholobus suberectus]|nr:Tudor, plant [Spatholobus suberectus]
MRLRKGSKVEILGNTDRLSVEWRCARIISGNGHTYSVQYDRYSTTSEASIERVSRKAIRPCPPLIKGIESWAVNDHVEVYDGSWKAATVLKFIGGEFYLVRLWISCKELKVSKVNMRARQSWQNGQWVVMPKGSGKSGVGKSSWYLISNSYKDQPENQRTRNIFSRGLDASSHQEPHMASSSTLKRMSPYGSSLVEVYPRKLRAVENMGECERFKAVTTAPLLQKVDAVAYPQNNMGEKCMHTSLTNGTNQYYETGKENSCSVSTHFLERMEEPDYSCSDLSSVGSCSVISSNSNKFSSDTLAGPCQDEDTLCSDAESLDVGDVDKGCSISCEEVVAERIHRASVGGLHALLPMAKYDARFASSLSAN